MSLIKEVLLFLHLLESRVEASLPFYPVSRCLTLAILRAGAGGVRWRREIRRENPSEPNQTQPQLKPRTSNQSN